MQSDILLIQFSAFTDSDAYGWMQYVVSRRSTQMARSNSIWVSWTPSGRSSGWLRLWHFRPSTRPCCIWEILQVRANLPNPFFRVYWVAFARFIEFLHIWQLVDTKNLHCLGTTDCTQAYLAIRILWFWSNRHHVELPSTFVDSVLFVVFVLVHWHNRLCIM